MAVKPATQEEIYILCPDADKYNITPHPDGKPWTKCCTNTDLKWTNTDKGNHTDCQCFMKKPPEGRSRFEHMKDYAAFLPDGSQITPAELAKKGGRFFCCHRKTDDGFHRVCAGWAAKFTKGE